MDSVCCYENTRDIRNSVYDCAASAFWQRQQQNCERAWRIRKARDIKSPACIDAMQEDDLA